MRTKDIIATGIDRNFLRKCIEEKIIHPEKQDNEWIINKNYIPQEYTQEDLEKVWNAYLYRKMGLSYTQVAALLNDEYVNLRMPLKSLIQKYENQIKELQSLVEFMKYVKCIGFIPAPPIQTMGSKTFNEYLIDFINYIDEDKKIKKFMPITDLLSESSSLEKLNYGDINDIENLSKEISPHITDKDKKEYSKIFEILNSKMSLEPNNKEIQDLIEELYILQKKFTNNPDLPVEDFVFSYIGILCEDSDLNAVYKNMFGDNLTEYLIRALLEFLQIKEPNKYRVKKIEN